MTLNVLIVDDSSFFQSRLKKIINEHPQLNVVGTASNGREAIEQVKKLHPDLVTMDYEMPMMDGVTAVRTIMSENPLPILMLSSMTYEGARITLDALDAGAVDFMTKNFSEISNDSPGIKKRIHETLLNIGRKSLHAKASVVTPITPKPVLPEPAVVAVHAEKVVGGSSSSAAPAPAPVTVKTRKNFRAPKIIVIGASTGGPAALTELLKKIPGNFPIPIILIQHMPETFTGAFAERLNNQCQVNVKEAENGDHLRPGLVLLAPGGKQMIIDSQHPSQVKVFETSKPVNYKPCVDITFASLANTYSHDTLAIVMTGMGNDGCEGARLLKENGSQVWTQSQESCLIYGMPMAIDRAGYSDGSYSIGELAEQMLAVSKARIH